MLYQRDVLKRLQTRSEHILSVLINHIYSTDLQYISTVSLSKFSIGAGDGFLIYQLNTIESL